MRDRSPRSKPILKALFSFLARPEDEWPKRVRRTVPALLFFLALFLLVRGVAEPSRVIFDEETYMAVVVAYGEGSLVNEGDQHRPWNFEHPPTAKWIMWASYELHGRPLHELNSTERGHVCRVFEIGTNPPCAPFVESLRRPGAILAAGGVVGLYWIALRLFRSLMAGLLAAALLLADPLYFVLARVAVLEVYPTAFLLLAFGLFLGSTRLHRIAGAIVLGLALSSKFPAAFLLPGFAFLAFSQSGRPERRDRLRHAAVYALAVPAAVYVLSYAPFVWVWATHGGPLFAVRTLFLTQWSSLTWAYAGPPGEVPAILAGITSPAWTWPWMRRPLVLYMEPSEVGGTVILRSLLTVGNPVTWWGGLAVGVYAAGGGLRRLWARRATRAREWLSAAAHQLDPRGAQGPGLLAAFLFLSAWLPFFLLARHAFLYYFLIAAPFLSLQLSACLAILLRRSRGAQVAALLVVALVLLAAHTYWPIVTFEAVTRAQFDRIVETIPWMEVWRRS